MKELIPEPNECALSVQSSKDMKILSITGHISELDTERIARALDDLFEKGCFKVVFDLAEVSYMTSSTLGQMMRAYRITKENDGFIRIVNPQPLVADIFRVTKLSRIFAIYDSLESALKTE